jgi:hypothetical protein
MSPSVISLYSNARSDPKATYRNSDKPFHLVMTQRSIDQPADAPCLPQRFVELRSAFGLMVVGGSQIANELALLTRACVRCD